MHLKFWMRILSALVFHICCIFIFLGMAFPKKRFGIHCHIDFSIKNQHAKQTSFPIHAEHLGLLIISPFLESLQSSHARCGPASNSIHSIHQHPQCGCRFSALLRALLSPCSLIVNHRELFTSSVILIRYISFFCQKARHNGSRLIAFC